MFVILLQFLHSLLMLFLGIAHLKIYGILGVVIQVIKIMHQIISQFSLPVSSEKSMLVYGSCQVGKSHHFHLFSSRVKSSSLFAIVYSNLWEPSPIPSNNENWYFVRFIYDYYEYDQVYFMKTKSQIFDIFKVFNPMVET